MDQKFNTKDRMNFFGIKPTKSLGQNFLNDISVVQEIVYSANITKEDIVVEVEENVDLIVSWLVASKDCRCPITQQINDAVLKLISRYDFVIFDCEFDLKYLNQLVDIDIDLTIITTHATEESAHLAKRIEEFNAKYAAGGQMGVVLNMVKGNETAKVYDLLQKFSLETLGVIPYDEALKENPVMRTSDKVTDAIKHFYFRLNLPQLRQ